MKGEAPKVVQARLSVIKKSRVIDHSEWRAGMALVLVNFLILQSKIITIN